MILVITEKPRVAQIITRVLSGGRYRSIRVSGVVTYWFYLDGEEAVVLPLEGHITEVDASEEFSRWGSVDPRDLITNENSIIKYYTSIRHVNALKRLAPKVDTVVIATDSDEEGCAIGADALKVVLKYNPGVEVKRLWLPTMDPSDIRESWRRLIKPKRSWAEAVDARRYIDAVIGFSATRELTLTAGGEGSSEVLSVGRVQTALLTLLYKREREIREFKPKPYWNVMAEVVGENGSSLVLACAKNPFWVEKEAREAAREASREGYGLVVGVESEVEAVDPPPPLNTTRMLRLLSAKLGVSTSKSMEIAESLYLDGLITYPRTDTDKFTRFNHRRVVEAIASSGLGIAKHASEVKSFNPGLRLTRNGVRYLGDHEPIAPISAPKPGLDNTRLKAWDLIARRYLALFYPPARVAKTRVLVSIGGVVFGASGRSVVDEGYLRVYGGVEPITSNPVPVLREGERVRVVRVYVRRQRTKPPPRYREAELVPLMERHGIGTKSSRPEIIKILKKRGYITVRKGVVYVTELGFKLAELLNSIWGDFATPAFTKRVEELMESVKSGRTGWRDVVKLVRREYLKLFDRLRENRDKVGGLVAEKNT